MKAKMIMKKMQRIIWLGIALPVARFFLILYAVARAIGRAINAAAVDILCFSALALIGYGAWLIYHPSGFIAAGAVLLLLILFGK